ncbi:MAG: ABC transporter permease [Acidimicrobiia bacterium]
MTSLRWAVSDAAVVTKRNLLRYVRIPQLLVFSTVQPVMFLLLFTFVFGGAIGAQLPPGVAYIDFLLPGLVVQTTMFGATQTGVGLADDMQKGFVDRFRSLPMARSAVLAGRTISDVTRNTLDALLTVGVGALIGFRIHQGAAEALLALVLLALFGFAFCWISALIGLAVKDVETAQISGFIWIFPLVFASSVFVPVDTMPGWLQAFARINPVTVAANAIRGLTFGAPPGQSTWAYVGYTVAWSVGLLAVFGTLAVRKYRRIT